MKYLIDSNIIIDYLRNYQPTVQLVNQLFSAAEAEVYISAISNLELHLGNSIINLKIQTQIDKILSQCYIVDITAEIAGKAGDLKREQKADIPDALIAACCLLHGLTLVTRNVKHFKNIPNLKIVSIEQ